MAVTAMDFTSSAFQPLVTGGVVQLLPGLFRDRIFHAESHQRRLVSRLSMVLVLVWWLFSVFVSASCSF